MKGTNDVIQPMLRVQHSYNGKTKYRIVFGYFRLVCSNGATISVKEMDEFNLSITGKHTNAIIESLNKLNTLMSVFAVEAKKITSALTEKYELLAGRTVKNLEKRLTVILKKNKIAAIKNSKFNTLQDIKGRILAEANGFITDEFGVRKPLGYNGVVNDWLVYNGINQYLNDDNRNISAPEKRMEIDSKVFEYILKNPEK
jgi:hypothetical protein